jgi:hypothetical protein
VFHPSLAQASSPTEERFLPWSFDQGTFFPGMINTAAAYEMLSHQGKYRHTQFLGKHSDSGVSSGPNKSFDVTQADLSFKKLFPLIYAHKRLV